MRCLARFCCRLVLVLGCSDAFVASAAAQQPLPDLYQLRAKGHESLTAPTARAIEAGLRWLVSHQDTDGKWDVDEFMKHDPGGDRCTGGGSPVHDIGITGLALLALLGEGNTTVNGPYKEAVASGVDFLLAQQQSEGTDRGLIGVAAPMDYIYDHLFATYALVEAYGLSRSAELAAAAKAAVARIERHRHKEFAWRYKVQGKAPDTPVTVLAWFVLRSAQEFGLSIDKSHAGIIEKWLDHATAADGVTGYAGKGGSSSRLPGEHAANFPVANAPTITAAALACRFMLGLRLDEQPVMAQQAALVLAHPPAMKDLYYWYYGSLAMRQVGGAGWTRWAKAVRGRLLPLQCRKGSARGSWDPDSVWGEEGGRIYSTAMAVLVLQAEYRYAQLSECTPVPAGLARFAQIRRKWRSGMFGDVARASKRLAAGVTVLNAAERQALEALDEGLAIEIDRVAQRVEQLAEGPDFLAARDRLKRISKKFAGLAPGRRASSILGTFARAKSIRREITAMGHYRKAMKRARGQKAALRKVLETYPGPYAGTLANSHLQPDK